MKRYIAATAVMRALLIGRLVIAGTAAGVSIQLAGDRRAPALALATIAVTTIVALAVLNWFPSVLRHRITVLTLDAAVMVAVLLISKGGVAYFCYAAGSAALAGVLLGTSGVVLWVMHTVLGLSVAVELLRGVRADTREIVAPYLIAAPMLDLVSGLGAAVVTGALYRYIDLSVATAIAAQRAAAASERARLAREMHDSVAKTLRGISFAAVALPSSLRRQPDLAEQLAATVSAGADAAVRETRELLAALRSDVPDQPFADTVRGVCATWSSTAGVRARLAIEPVEPSLAARYELSQILREALQNVSRHAAATEVEVALGRSAAGLRMTIRDDGAGFALPGDLSDLTSKGSFGVVGMAERAKTVGGVLRVASRPGHGTTVVVDVPASVELRARGMIR